ncbi:aromatic amino acid ammonia-lyase [Cytophagaceae bacterium DM2B3-1]|uniref:Aromatic amino acid ammonia-lyase n=1 Tax=Xanthocytophaga flava TaxID=3048013 RepID=A0ABT7CT89_9BACT|nr:aromatic amino acid ammonia-lyase [Xanthocytophaga flavus]MDJ1496981.1 aromatic amino acid ammonia-lyase [Xanthocytophaga flavus]
MLSIGEKLLELNNFVTHLSATESISIDETKLQNIRSNFSFLEKFAKDKVIYGINTGFGPMAQYKISDEDRVQLQYNLIRSHCSGTGAMLPPLFVRAAMIARLNSLIQARSGIHEELVLLLKDLLNHQVTPVVYEHGGVGASGDLVQLAHLSLCLIGEGKVHYKGEILPASQVFQQLQLKPLAIHIREGLAIMNGTSFMTGIALVNLIQAKKVLHWAVIATSLITEITESYDDFFSIELNEVKWHKGQNNIAKKIREQVYGSQLVKSRTKHLYKKVDDPVFEEKVQEYYSIRCVPQILGPVEDTLELAEKLVIEELNSVNDNPIVNHEVENVFHGGNFHGDYVSLEMDKVKIAIAKLAMLSERQLNYLMNHRINEKLPPFLNKGVLGLNFGFQGVQFTATSTTAEIQTLSYPMYLHSIPNNNDNQDIVSMGTNAALICNKVIDNASQVLAIELMALVQAIDILNIKEKLSKANQQVINQLQQTFQAFTDDQPQYEKIQQVKDLCFPSTGF